jgi:hypothetical protein
MRIVFQADDRIVAAAAGGIASLSLAAVALVKWRRGNRVQAARSALLGRPTAYRLHLHGTGIELAPWERNFVAECVVRHPPENAFRVGPVEPRPGEGDGSVIKDSQAHMAPGAGFRVDQAAVDEDSEGAGDEPAVDQTSADALAAWNLLQKVAETDVQGAGED